MKTKLTIFVPALALLAIATAWLLRPDAMQSQRAPAPQQSAVTAGSPEARQQASAFRAKVQNKVINEDLREAWLSEHELIYRLQSSLTQWEFRIADAKRGTSAAAFDHAKVAAAIPNTKADALPFVRFVADDNDLYAMTGGGEVTVIARKNSRVSALDPGKPTPLDLAPSARRRSMRGNGDSRVLFLNQSASEVRLYWVDESGEETSYGKIAAGASHSQHSFAGHLWLVKDASGQALGYYLAEQHLGIARLDGTPHLAEAPERVATAKARVVGIGGSQVTIAGLGKENTKIELRHAADRSLSWPASLSDDERYLVVTERKPGKSTKVSFVESSPKDQVQPKFHTFDYTKPGDPINQDRWILYDLKKDKQIAIDNALFDNPWSLSHFAWSEDGESFSFLYNERGHQVLRLLRVDAKSGDVSVMVEEKSDTFIDYSQKTYLYRFPKSDDFFWASERDGWNHLYWIDGKNGKVKTQCTKGAWVLRSVERVDLEKGRIFISALGVHAGQDPYHLHYGVVDYKRGSVTWLTEGDGNHAIEYSPTREYLVDRYSRVDLAPVHEIRNARNGKLILELAKADLAPLEATGWNAPKRFVAKGRDGTTDIYGYILFPSWMKKGTKLPVIENIYAGPHGQHVPKSFSAWRGQRELSELGFIVVRIDGMGTNWRSKAFHDVCWKNLGDGGFPDRIKWMQAAAQEHPEMDLSRVGIYGGSAGGQNALRAMLAHGDFYKAAAADCGCHDNRMDKIWWNEAWMGWPIGPHYAEQSNVTQAKKLEGALLLTVGEMDRNVDPASTMQVVDALIKADKDFELIVFPGGGHGIGESNYGRRRRADFFIKNLLPE